MTMRVIRDARPGGPETVLAIGAFDGIHRGHLALFARVAEQAGDEGCVPAVLTFEPLPREHLFPDSAPPRLSSVGARLAAFAESGIEAAYLCRFNAAFASLTPTAFAERLRLLHGARHVWVGEDFRFGARRAGDVNFLREEGRRLGFTVNTLSTVDDGNGRISSTRVRAALSDGDMAQAAQLLGRPYAMCGRVVHGAKLGRTLGFPTANVALPRGRPPMTGIYAVKCVGASTRGLEGVASLGYKPAVGHTGPATLEAFLFDFSGDLYGRRLTIEFLKKLREEENFPSLDALVAQMRRDCDAARAYFRSLRT